MRIKFKVEVEGTSSTFVHEQFVDAEVVLSMHTPMLLLRQMTNDLVGKFFDEGHADELKALIEDEVEIEKLREAAEVARKRLYAKVDNKLTKSRART